MKRNITKLLHSAIPLLLVVGLLLTISNGCNKAKDDYYSRPSDLAGPLWEQLTSNTNFAKFTDGISRVNELKRIINTSGLYTVFAPTDKACQAYFDKRGIKSFADLPALELKQLINYHMVYNMWYSTDFIAKINLEDLKTDDAHRYKTRSKDVYDSVGYKIDDKTGQYIVVADPKEVDVWRTVRKPEKVLNIYMENYVVKQDIVADYKQIYEADYGYFNVDGAQVILQLDGDKEIYKKEDLIRDAKGKIKNEGSVKQMYDLEAANGSIHAINRVLIPTSNIEVTIDKLCQKSVLISKPDSVKYVDLLNRFIKLTFDQANSVAENKNTVGGLDSLFNKTYVDKDEVSLGFDFSSETSNVTLFLPTNEALQKYFIEKKITSNYDLITLDGKLSKQEFDSISDYALRQILNASVVTKMVWPTKTKKSYVSVAGDTINKVAFPSINKIVPASNGIVYLVNEVVAPSSFSTVAQVPLLNSNFKMLSKILEYTGLYSYLTYQFHHITFFAPTDAALIAGGITYGYVGEKNEVKVGQFYFQKKKVRKETLDSLIRFCILRDEYSYEALDGLATAGTFVKTRHGAYMAFSHAAYLPNILIGADANATAPVRIGGSTKCTNGYVHIVDGMPAAPLKTVASVLAEQLNTKEFVKILKKQKISDNSTTSIFDLLGDPESADRFTVLAPSDTLITYQLCDTTPANLPTTRKQDRMLSDSVYGNVIWRKIALAHIIKLPIFSDGTNMGKDIDGKPLYNRLNGGTEPANNTMATFKNGDPYQVRLFRNTGGSDPFGFESSKNNPGSVLTEVENYFEPARLAIIRYKCFFFINQINLQGINGVVHVANLQQDDKLKWYNFEKVFEE